MIQLLLSSLCYLKFIILVRNPWVSRVMRRSLTCKALEPWALIPLLWPHIPQKVPKGLSVWTRRLRMMILRTMMMMKLSLMKRLSLLPLLILMKLILRNADLETVLLICVQLTGKWFMKPSSDWSERILICLHAMFWRQLARSSLVAIGVDWKNLFHLTSHYSINCFSECHIVWIWSLTCVALLMLSFISVSGGRIILPESLPWWAWPSPSWAVDVWTRKGHQSECPSFWLKAISFEHHTIESFHHHIIESKPFVGSLIWILIVSWWMA